MLLCRAFLSEFEGVGVLSDLETAVDSVTPLALLLLHVLLDVAVHEASDGLNILAEEAE